MHIMLRVPYRDIMLCEPDSGDHCVKCKGLLFREGQPFPGSLHPLGCGQSKRSFLREKVLASVGI